MTPLPTGKRTAISGWLLQSADLGWAAWLDGRSFTAPSVPGPTLLAARAGQAVVLGLALLLMALADERNGDVLAETRTRAPEVIAAGAVIFTLGYMLGVSWPAFGWITAAAALLVACGAAALARQRPNEKLELSIVSAGLAIDAILILAGRHSGAAFTAFLGSPDGLRLRLLRLGQIAALALPILSLAYSGLTQGSERRGQIFRLGRRAMIVGVTGMPAALAAAALVDFRLKYLLCIPACALFAATIAALCYSWRRVTPLERSGWLLLSGSMAVGLAMGVFAFNGPVPAPHMIAAYNDAPRRLLRLAHTYAIVLGMWNIYLGRRLDGDRSAARWWLTSLAAAGEVTTLACLLLVAFFHTTGGILSVGPCVLAITSACSAAYPQKLAMAQHFPRE